MKTTQELMQEARAAWKQLQIASTEAKNEALSKMADHLVADTEEILKANAEDVEKSRGVISDVMIDRLLLTEERIQGMAQGIREVVDLPDPVGKVLNEVERPGGLIIRKTSMPLGVIAIIYESRPNVTSDAAALAIKSGNACVLRGGKEAFASANAIVGSLKKGLVDAGFSPDLVQLVQDTTRQSANELMEAVGLIDLLIPRGGAGLIRACTENAKVPCIQTGTGICSVYVDKDADLEMAAKIVENAKTSRPSVCNAEETLLVHKDVAEEFLPILKQYLVDKRNAENEQPVELRVDEKAAGFVDGTPATAEDYDTEFLDYILAVRVVDSVEEAIDHIAQHSTKHSDVIITNNEESARLFTMLVDSAAVYVNASSRFTDGGEFGLGCEMGISTQKLHARGPVGLEELNTYKYIVTGNGNIR